MRIQLGFGTKEEVPCAGKTKREYWSCIDECIYSCSWLLPWTWATPHLGFGAKHGGICL